jgi:hypothetical protein
VHYAEAESALQGLLADAGLELGTGIHARHAGLSAPDAARGWEVFKAFGSIPAEGVGPHAEDDGLLFETGVYAWHYLDGPRFSLSFTRQFALYEEDEYDRMEQLHLSFYWAPTPELEGLEKAQIWSFGHELDDFFRLVEASPGFREPLELGLPPVGYQLGQEQV